MPLLLLMLAAVLHAQPLPRLAHAGFALSLDNGALTIAQVRPGSIAAIAGLHPGDVILTNTPDTAFARSLLRRPDGDRLILNIRRGNQTFEQSLIFIAPPKEAQPDFDIDYSDLTVNAHRRRLLHTRPRTRKNAPVILWLAGSGCASQESPNAVAPEIQLIYALTRAGYQTLRVEKTGVGDSEGPPCYSPQGDLTQEIHAYAAAIAKFRPARIFLFAHSAGATLAPLVLRAAGPVQGVIAAGGMGTSFLQYMLEMRRRELTLAHKPVASEMAIHTRCLEALLIEGQSPDAIEAADPACRRRVRFDSPPAYIAEWAKLDLATEWRAAPVVPILVLYGTGDFVTSLSQSQKLAEIAPKAKLKTLSMDHSFLDYATPEEAYAAEEGKPSRPPRLHPGVVKTALEFLKRNR